MGSFEFAARRRAYSAELWSFLLREQELRETKDDARFDELMEIQAESINSLVLGGNVLRLVWEGMRARARKEGGGE